MAFAVAPAPPAVVEKPWGVTRCIYRGPHTEVWHASIRAGGKSSVHRHEWKHNDFYVLSGRLAVRREDGGKHALLDAGEKSTLPAGVEHQFLALTDVELIETYWLGPINPDDIIRRPVDCREVV